MPHFSRRTVGLKDINKKHRGEEIEAVFSFDSHGENFATPASMSPHAEGLEPKIKARHLLRCRAFARVALRLC